MSRLRGGGVTHSRVPPMAGSRGKLAGEGLNDISSVWMLKWSISEFPTTSLGPPLSLPIYVATFCDKMMPTRICLAFHPVITRYSSVVIE